MEEIYNSIVTINDDYIFPTSYKWKKVYVFADEYLKENCKENYSKLKNNLDEFLNVLIKNGDVYEDVVLKTSLYYFLCKNSSFKMNLVKESAAVKNGVSILTSKQDNLQKIFTNEEYKYLNKIKLSYLIFELQQKDLKKDIVNYMTINNESKIITEQYKEYCSGKLFKLLTQLV